MNNPAQPNPAAPQQQQQQQQGIQLTPDVLAKAMSGALLLPREQLKFLYKTLLKLKEDGKELSDPNYKQISKLLKIQVRLYQTTKGLQGQNFNASTFFGTSTSQQPAAAASTAIPQVSYGISPQQKDQLKAQIYSFKFHILKNLDVPPLLLNAVKGINPEANLRLYEQQHMNKDQQQNLTQQHARQQPMPQQQQPLPQATNTFGMMPQATVPTVLPPQQSPQQHGRGLPTAVAPAAQRVLNAPGVGADVNQRKPAGLDLQTLLAERERRIQVMVKQRYDALKNIVNSPTVLNHEKLKAVIEIKKLKLLSVQRQVRGEVLSESKVFDEARHNGPKRQAANNQTKAQQKRHRANQISAESGKNQLHKKFLHEVTIINRKRVTDNARNHQQVVQKINKELQTSFDKKAKSEKDKKEKHDRARLKALKEKDEEAYLKLLQEAKVDRLTELIKQTDDCLKQLGAQLVSERVDAQDDDKQHDSDDSDEDDEGLFGDKKKEKNNIYTNFLKNQKAYYKLAHNYREKIDKQPTILSGGDLKPYQVQGLQWLVSLYNNKLNGILADEMGLGKTIQTISLLAYLYEAKAQTGPHLVIMPLSTLENWSLEFERWCPTLKVIKYMGKAPDRKKLQQVFKEKKFNVVLCQYEYISRDKNILKKIPWNYIIIDEGHRIKNHNCKLVVDLAKYNSKHRVLLTGTPLQNDLKELWSLLHFLLPKIFDSALNFEAWFSMPFLTGSNDKVGMSEEETLLIISRLHQVLRPFLLRREKSEVETQLPEKVEKVIRCELSAMQKRFYRQIQNDNRLLLTGDKKAKRASLNNSVMQLRKVCNHPYLFLDDWTGFAELDIIRCSGKFELLDRMLPKMKAGGHRVLLFSQMTHLLDILQVYFDYRGYKYLRLDGNVKPEERGQLVKNFNAKDSPYFVFLLSTRAGGLGLNLQSADTVIIFDSDWNPQQDLQAQARAHRIGQTKSVRVFTLITATDVEERIYHRAQEKKEAEAKVIQAGKFNQKSTHKERQEFLTILMRKEDDFKKFEIPNDDQLNTIMARSEDELVLFCKLDAERAEQEKQYYAAQGKQVPARLMEDEELPSWIPKEDEIQQMDEEEELKGRGSRASRRRINYSEHVDVDGLDLGSSSDDNNEEDKEDEDDEKAALNDGFIDDGEAEDANPNEEFEAKDNSDDDKSDESAEEEKPKRRGRKRKSAPTTDDDTPQKPAKRQRKSAAYRSAVHGECTFEEVAKEMTTPTQQTLLTWLQAFISATDQSGRNIASMFLELPDRNSYADYYALIKNPISFDQIEKKLRTNQYLNGDQFYADVRLLCENAQKYNTEDSDIYQDSLQLLSMLPGQPKQSADDSFMLDDNF